MVESLNVQIRELIDAWSQGFKRQPTLIGIGNVYFAPSDSEGPEAFHIVARVQYTDKSITKRGWVCSCPAFRYNRTGEETCKHIIRVQEGIAGADDAKGLLKTGRPSKSTSASASKRKTVTPRSARSGKSSAKVTKRASTGSSSKKKASAKSKSSQRTPVTRKRTSASRKGQ